MCGGWVGGVGSWVGLSSFLMSLFLQPSFSSGDPPGPRPGSLLFIPHVRGQPVPHQNEPASQWEDLSPPPPHLPSRHPPPPSRSLAYLCPIAGKLPPFSFPPPRSGLLRASTASMADCPGACVRTPLAEVQADDPDQAECATTRLPGCPRGRPRRTNAILFSKAATFRGSALFDVAGPSPHCLLTSCRAPPTLPPHTAC